MDKITYAGIEVDFDALPPISQRALALRGLTHFLGNEQASKVSGKAKAALIAEPSVVLGDDEKAELLKGFRESALNALLEGTIGVRESNGEPAMNPVEKAARAIAWDAVADILKKSGLKQPKGTETINVGGNDYTRNQLIDRRLNDPRYKDSIAKAAEKQVRDAKKKLETAGDISEL